MQQCMAHLLTILTDFVQTYQSRQGRQTNMPGAVATGKLFMKVDAQTLLPEVATMLP